MCISYVHIYVYSIIFIHVYIDSLIVNSCFIAVRYCMFLYYWILAYVYDSYGVVHTVCKAHNYYIPNYIPQWILLFPHIGPGLLHRSPELARRCWDRYSKGPSTSAADIKHQETADDRCWNKQESLDLLFRAPKKPSDVDIILTTVLVCFGGNAINTNRYVQYQIFGLCWFAAASYFLKFIFCLKHRVNPLPLLDSIDLM